MTDVTRDEQLQIGNVDCRSGDSPCFSYRDVWELYFIIVMPAKDWGLIKWKTKLIGIIVAAETVLDFEKKFRGFRTSAVRYAAHAKASLFCVILSHLSNSLPLYKHVLIR